MIINQPTYSQGQQRMKMTVYGINSRLLMTLCLWMVLMGYGQAKETVLISSLDNKNDRILFRILQETNYLLRSDKKIKNYDFQCYSIIKNDLVPNHIKTYKILDYSINVFSSIILAQKYSEFKYQGSDNQHQKMVLYHKLDKMLDLLIGKCLYFTTLTFITQYCHKMHVRQFDDDYTKYYNQKPAYQDFNLGLFSQERITVFNGIRKTPDVAPKRADFTSEELFIQGLFKPSSWGISIEFEQSEDSRIFHSNSPMVQNSLYLTDRPKLVEIICKIDGKNIHQITLALIVGAYDAINFKKQPLCKNYQQVSVHQYKQNYHYRQQIRLFKSFLYGNVEEYCTEKWNWQRKGRPFQQAELTEGSTLFISFEDEITKIRHNQFVTIKKIYHSGLVELEQQIGASFDVLNQVTNTTFPHVSHLTQCQLLFNKPISQKHTQNNKYIGNNIMKLNSQIIDQTQMTKLGCICGIATQNASYLFDMDVSVGKKLWADYYEMYYHTNRQLYLHDLIKDALFKGCSTINCSKFRQKGQTRSKQNKKGFTSITKLNSKNKIYKFNEEVSDNIFILSIRKSGIIRLITHDSQGNICKYVLTEGQLLKIIEFQNGTKEIQKQNYVLLEYYTFILR